MNLVEADAHIGPKVELCIILRADVGIGPYEGD